MKAKRDPERGTVAIVVALSATMIFALCALAVDLGSAFARKRDIQTQADLATLAAAAHLPHSASTQSDIYAAATSFSNKNKVAGQDASFWNFSDSDKANGFIEFDSPTMLRLFAPQSEVDFWLAPVAGLPTGMKVSAVAAAEIRSPGRGLPFFVSTSCGWGSQTILDQTAGPQIPPTYSPTLDPTSTPPSAVVINSITPDKTVFPSPAVSLTINAQFKDIDTVGFTAEDGSHVTIDNVNVNGNSGTFSVPSGVLTQQKVWWVRLREKAKPAQGSKPAVLAAWTSSTKPFVVGDPPNSSTPACDTKNSGNFGSLELSRDDVSQPARYLVENMALGVQHDFTVYPTTPYPASCSGQAAAVMDNGAPVAGRALNCLTTDTGSDLAQKATDAFITGTAQGSPGRLDKPTGTGCSPAKTTARRTLSDITGNPSINDDVLSCFFTNDTVTVGQVSKSSGAPAHVISPDIFDSPRFFWLPVLASDPSGGAGSYAITGFRPVFITEQADAGTRVAPAATLNNGIEMAGNGKSIEKIRVRAINPLSLPEFVGDGGDNTVEYLGQGTKVIRLIE